MMHSLNSLKSKFIALSTITKQKSHPQKKYGHMLMN